MAKPKHKKPTRKLTSGDKMIIGSAIISAFLVLFIAIALIAIRNNNNSNSDSASSQSSSESSSSMSSTESSQSVTTVSEDKAKTQIKEGIETGLEDMVKMELVSGQSVDLYQLTTNERLNLLNYFSNDQVFQDFNDILNVSNPDNSTTYTGDAGIGVRKHTMPNNKTKYKLDKLTASLDDIETTDKTYVYKLNMDYHPVSYKTLHKKLIVKISKTTGKITSFAEDIE